MTPPCCVNLMALPTRFRTICRSLRGSPSSASGVCGATSHERSSRLASASMTSVFMAPSMHSLSENGILSTVRCPASILEMSRTSLTMASNDSPEARTSSRHSRCSAVSSVCSATCVRPMIAFIGVRISWLMLARNSDFARLACSAACLATSNSASARSRICISRRSWSWAEIRFAVRSRILISRSSFALSKSRCALRCRSSCVARSALLLSRSTKTATLDFNASGSTGLKM